MFCTAPLKKRETAVAAPKSTASSKSLRIGALNDSFEQEAHRVANEVMARGAVRQPWSLSRMSIGAPLQRKCSCGGFGECEECKKKETALQRKRSGSADVLEAPPIVHDVLRSPGQPLDHETRSFFEERFGYDFSQVRVHTGAKAAESARQVNALAYTVGRDIVFEKDQFNRDTAEGDRLLAHELAHVVQQGGSNGSAHQVLQREVKTGGPKDGQPAPGEKVKGTDCAGWESDPQSFSKRAAEHYLRSVWQPGWSVQSIACGGGLLHKAGEWSCVVYVNVGTGLIKIEVKLSPKDKLVRVERSADPKRHMACFYSYSCSSSGELVLEDRPCPTF